MKTLTCNGCAYDGACERQKDKRAALRGLGITTVKFICKERRDAFAPGQPVIFTTYVVDEDEAYRGGSMAVRYAGYAVQQKGAKLVGFIKPEEPDLDEEGFPFDTKGRGFVKMPIKRVAADPSREPIALSMCSWCGDYPALGLCGKDPSWTPDSKCDAENMARADEGGPSRG
ncbi:hypothetical protein [Ancylobacter sp.]|uniref:hypothetical protein n=1 Tax=Ancylobacter sp. TaxID=1872567 RepID=UPI003D0BC4E0